MKNAALSLLVTSAVVLSGSGIAYGHHSFASEFDIDQPVEVRGIVTKVEWNNPHVWFYMDVEDPDTGEVVNWGFEMGAPHQLQRRGWTRTTMQIGDELVVEGSGSRNGSPRVNARSVTTADGRVLGAASSADQTLGSNSQGPDTQNN